MRLAWFSPMPPVPTGVAACSAELVAALGMHHEIEVYRDDGPLASAAGTESAHNFVWRHRRRPYDLTIFQLGNSSHHDYMWPYLFRYPGLTVLHDAHLHHARAAALLRTKRAADYRAEFRANHPDTNRDLAELAIAGFDNHLYYAWPMTRLVVEASRLTAVHTAPLARAIEAELPGAAVASLRLGHGTLVAEPAARAFRDRVRQTYRIPADAIVFGIFGGLTPEKRIPQVLDAMRATLPYAPATHLLLAGAPASHYDAAADVRARGLDSRTTITGYLDSDDELTAVIAACDVSLNLRWPTAREMSGPWLRALAAGRPTIVTDLAHLSDVPSLDPRTWRPTPGSGIRDPDAEAPICVAIDILDEDHSLRLAMRRLASDPRLRESLGAAAQRYWEQEHSISGMVEDYERLLAEAATRPAPQPLLPPHLTADGSGLLKQILEDFSVAPVWR
jgi:glycosyltransferase involved in cell wall biosynthesis